MLDELVRGEEGGRGEKGTEEKGEGSKGGFSSHSTKRVKGEPPTRPPQRGP